MSPVRSFLSIAAVLTASMATVGCYDLSDPSGPRPEDFRRDRTGTEPQPQGQTSAEVSCAGAPCTGVDHEQDAPITVFQLLETREDISASNDDRDGVARGKPLTLPLDAP